MKIQVKELKPNPSDSEEYKQGNLYQHILIFEGECGCFQLRGWDTNISVPGFIEQNSEGKVVVIYSYPSNVQCVLENGTLWANPAITEQNLQKLKEARAKEKTVREEKLSAIAT